MISPTYFLACRVFEDAGFTGRLRAVPEGSDGVDIGFLRRELKGVEDRWKRDGEEGDVPVCTNFLLSN